MSVAATSVPRASRDMSALAQVQSPRSVRAVAWALIALLFLLAIALLIVPWQQNLQLRSQASVMLNSSVK